MAKRKTQEPWDRSNPRKKTAKSKGSRKLTPGQKAEARGRARKAGREYPNLVDNMAVARKKSSGGAKKKPSTKRTAKKASAKRGTAAKRTTPRKRSTAKRSTKSRTSARKIR